LVEHQQVNDAPLDKNEAKAQLNRCLNEGAISYTNHFREEFLNDDLTTEDVLAVCRSGAIPMAPEQDIKSGYWKYRIEALRPINAAWPLFFSSDPGGRCLLLHLRGRLE